MTWKSKRVTAGLAGVAAALAALPAAAQAYPYRDWVRVGGEDNIAGAVFRPGDDSFQIWDNLRDGVPVTLGWNYKNIRDRWKWLEPQDGAQHTFDLDLRENRRVYFYLVTGYGSSEIVQHGTG